MSNYKQSRRRFIRQASIATMGYTTMFSTIFNMNTINAAARMNSRVQDDSDYKAMVCIFMYGGADSFNMLIPKGNAEYLEYETSRSNLSIPQADILQINPLVGDGKTYGVHPSMPEVQTLFDAGRLAFISNVGSLVEPTTKAMMENDTANVPLGLFSHSDFSQHWQSGWPHERSSVGWGGRIADLMQDADNNVNIPLNLSMSGNNVFQAGQETVEFTMNYGEESGVSGIPNYNTPWGAYPGNKAAIDNMIDADYTNIFQQTYIDITRSARDGSEALSDAILALPDFDTVFDQSNSLALSLELTAKVIAARETLGMTRQVFFIGFGGWDHHDDLNSALPGQLSIISNALGSFNEAMEEIDMVENVVTFSASEFGRTLTSNGNGCDHAWGGNSFVMGGPVIGQKMYGIYPSLELNNDLDIGGGVFIPTTSTDEYFAELALWFGVASTDLVTLFPNIGNFYDTTSGSNPIGFLNI